MEKQFPRTMVEGISLPRMLIGSNWLLGYSHTGAAADKMIKRHNSSKEAMLPLFEAYLKYGVDAIMAPLDGAQVLLDTIDYAEQKTGKKIHRIDTPIINVDDSPQARKEAEQTIRRSRENGAEICLIHHASAEQLVNKNKKTIERIGDYLAMIRDCGMVPGLSAHMPELVLYSDLNEYDVQTYIQIFNCVGFLMQVEVEAVAKIIHQAKKPVMSIKPFAAGRITPYVGLTFNWNALRPCDMITVGAMTADEAYEDIEISFATFEKRYPVLDGRGSPASQQDVLKK